MKKIYVLIEKENAEVISASKTRRALEELMCDMFMADYQQEMQDAADSHWINVENPSDECRLYAKETWDFMMRNYKRDYEIERVNLI